GSIGPSKWKKTPEAMPKPAEASIDARYWSTSGFDGNGKPAIDGVPSGSRRSSWGNGRSKKPPLAVSKLGVTAPADGTAASTSMSTVPTSRAMGKRCHMARRVVEGNRRRASHVVARPGLAPSGSRPPARRGGARTMSEPWSSHEDSHPVMTLEEWSRLPEDDDGELLDGRLVEEETPDYVHEVIVGWLLRTFGAWVAPLGGLAGGSGA